MKNKVDKSEYSKRLEDNMKFIYSEEDVISFGNYMLSEERKILVDSIGNNNISKHRRRRVTRADFLNWRDKHLKAK